MSYSIPNIIQWAKISQPLARYGETKRQATSSGNMELDLDVQLYNARKDLEYAYAQAPTADSTFTIGQYVLALCGVYLQQAQAATGGGGSVSPINPSTMPAPQEFIVSASSLIPTGGTTLDLSALGFVGFNIILVRGHFTQSTVDDGGMYYSWDSTTAILTLVNGPAQLTELFQIYPTL